MDLQDLKIDLKGLKDGLNRVSFDLDDTYFTAIEADEVSGGCVHVKLDITRVQDEFFSLEVHETGTIVVPCDVCLDPMDQSIEVHEYLEVKLGKESSEEDDLVMVPLRIYSSQYSYQACACTWKMQPCNDTNS